MALIFLTSDGDKLYLIGNEWVDSVDAESVELSFANVNEHPVDADGEPLDGEFVK